MDRLLEVAPKSLTRFSFANSGAEAVENAIKVARAHTGKQNIVSVDVSPVLPHMSLGLHKEANTHHTSPSLLSKTMHSHTRKTRNGVRPSLPFDGCAVILLPRGNLEEDRRQL